MRCALSSTTFCPSSLTTHRRGGQPHNTRPRVLRRMRHKVHEPRVGVAAPQVVGLIQHPHCSIVHLQMGARGVHICGAFSGLGLGLHHTQPTIGGRRSCKYTKLPHQSSPVGTGASCLVAAQRDYRLKSRRINQMGQYSSVKGLSSM